MGQAAGPGPGLGAAPAPLASPTRGCGSVLPREARTLGPGPGVMPVQPGPQLSGLWFSSASSHHTRHSSGSDS